MTSPEIRNTASPEYLLERLERQLRDIETREILDDLTAECLEEKGFIGDKPVEVSRKQHRRETEREHLVFEPGLDFLRVPADRALDDLDMDELLVLPDIAADSLIAVREIDEKLYFTAGKNVRCETGEGNTERYFATSRGKAVIIGAALHIVATDRDCGIEVAPSLDGMEAAVTIVPARGNGAPLTIEGVLSELYRAGVSHGIDEQDLRDKVNEATESRREQRFVAARGTAPLPGKNGRIEYFFDTSRREFDFAVAPDGRIDYRSVNSILMTSEGTALARVHEPEPGISGTNVRGEPLTAPPGMPAKLTAGRGVAFRPDRNEFVAECDGTVVLNGSLIEVMNTYVIKGDVDYSTGNIQFNGTIIIGGTVLDGFEVRADGDILVCKNVESSRLEAGRDIVIRGGVMGRGKGLVSAGRDIHVEYVQNGRLEAQGDIVIGNFAINSYIFTSRTLTVQEKRGIVVGGEIYAQRGIDVRMLGSEAGVKTFVEVGTDFLVMRRIAELDEAIGFCEDSIRKIDEGLKTVSAALKGDRQLTRKKGSLIKQAFRKKEALQERLRVMLAKKEELLARSRENEMNFVKVKDTCYPDVQVKIHTSRMTISKRRDNVRFHENRGTGEIVVSAY